MGFRNGLMRKIDTDAERALPMCMISNITKSCTRRLRACGTSRPEPSHESQHARPRPATSSRQGRFAHHAVEDAELLVSVGSAGFEILAAKARLGIDLIVMGSRGESALARGMLGSLASKVLRGAACPALVVR